MELSKGGRSDIPTLLGILGDQQAAGLSLLAASGTNILLLVVLPSAGCSSARAELIRAYV